MMDCQDEEEKPLDEKGKPVCLEMLCSIKKKKKLQGSLEFSGIARSRKILLLLVQSMAHILCYRFLVANSRSLGVRLHRYGKYRLAEMISANGVNSA